MNKERFKMDKKATIISIVLVVVILLVTGFTIGFLNGLFIDDKSDNTILYKNEEMNIQFEVPNDWEGKYIVDEQPTENHVGFVYKYIPSKWQGAGTIFYIKKIDSSKTKEYIKERINLMSILTVLCQNEDYAYVLGSQGINHPIFESVDKEDLLVVDDYRNMLNGIEKIRQTFALIKEVQVPENTNESNTFSVEEIQSAKSVVGQYFQAKNERNRSAVLSTLTEWHNAPNVILWQDEKITVNDIRINPNDQMRTDYIKYGRGSINNATLENVIVFRVDYTVNIPQGGKSAYNNGDYKDYGIILVRDNKNSQWLIDDMGY